MTRCTLLMGPDEVPSSGLDGHVVTILGYGNQGRAHALNLRDSGHAVVIGARPDGQGAATAAEDDFPTCDLAAAAAQGDLIIIALPDELHRELLAGVVESIRDDGVVGFLHGFSIHAELVTVPERLGVVMIAPKGPGAALRRRFQQGYGLPSLLAVHQDNPSQTARSMALAWAAGIGSDRAAVIETTFQDETETDHFGEQAVLCGGMTWLFMMAYDVLVAAGYPEELAYIECCYEIKQVADLVHTSGIAGMLDAISTTAELGALHAGPQIVDDHLRATLTGILQQIQSGTFATGIGRDQEAGWPQRNACRAAAAAHPSEEVGRRVRSWMPWLSKEAGDT